MGPTQDTKSPAPQQGHAWPSSASSSLPSPRSAPRAGGDWGQQERALPGLQGQPARVLGVLGSLGQSLGLCMSDTALLCSSSSLVGPKHPPWSHCWGWGSAGHGGRAPPCCSPAARGRPWGHRRPRHPAWSEGGTSWPAGSTATPTSCTATPCTATSCSATPAVPPPFPERSPGCSKVRGHRSRSPC